MGWPELRGGFRHEPYSEKAVVRTGQRFSESDQQSQFGFAEGGQAGAGRGLYLQKLRCRWHAQVSHASSRP